MSRSFTLFFVCLTAIAFASFGAYHLGKFETTDEHLWKYKRIGDYWEGWRDWKLEKTYINDKPGITVALFSGFGLIPDLKPERSELVTLPPEETRFFEDYREDLTETVNIRFRLPILILSTVALFLFFFLLNHLFHSLAIALFTTLFIGMNPILIGIAQIINPDSFFWIFSFLSVLSYLVLLFHNDRRFLFLTGFLTGLALLSKYTAFLLFPLFSLFLLSAFLFLKDTEHLHLTRKNIVQHFFHLVQIFALAALTFFLFLPATFLDPSLFFKGASQFFLPKYWPYWTIFLGILIILGLIFWKYGSDKRLLTWQTHSQSWGRFLEKTLAGIIGSIIFLSLINVWTGQALAPVEALRDAAYANEPQAFNFKPILLKTAPVWEKWFEIGLMEVFPLVFSLTLPLFFTLLLGLIGLWRGFYSPRTKAIVVAIFAFVLVYLGATYYAKVVTNVRYMIVLFPLLALAAALIVDEWLRQLVKNTFRKKALTLIAIFLFLHGIFILWNIRPFYFSYANILLPREQSIHDSWGHGFYEAAQYLNQLPNAHTLNIWSNSNTICRFFVGRCLQSRQIDLSLVQPDYIVMSKRGIVKIRNQPVFKNNPWPHRDVSYYIRKVESNPDWQLLINGRPDNFVNIVRFEKEPQIIRIGVITNIHAQQTSKVSPPENLPERSRRGLISFIDHMNSRFHPHFTVEIGDFIEGTRRRGKKSIDDFRITDQIMNRLTTAHYHVIGNHELRGLTRTEWIDLAHIHQPATYYYFDTADLRTIVLDSIEDRLLEPDIDEDLLTGNYYHLSEKQITWLEATLHNAQAMRKIVFIHVPVIDGEDLGFYQGKPIAPEQSDRLRRLFETHSVLAVFSGHVERLQFIEKGQTRYFVLPGLWRSQRKKIHWVDSYYEVTVGNQVNVKMLYKKNESEPYRELFIPSEEFNTIEK